MLIEAAERDAEAIAITVPDAFRPCLDLAAAQSLGLGRLAQRQRRSEILAATSRMLARRGCDHVSLREIAQECGVSIQTIYNLIGDRSHLLSAAVSEFVEKTVDYAQRAESYPSIFLALTDIYWRMAIEREDYMRHATLNYFLGDCTYRNAVTGVATRIFAQYLERLRRRGVLRDGIEPAALAARLSCLAPAIIFSWASSDHAGRDIRAALAEAYGLMLCGALRGREVETIEHWLAAVRCPHRRGRTETWDDASKGR